MTHCCGCMAISTAGILNANFLPPKIIEVLDTLRNANINVNSDALFTIFWDDNQNDDLDLWLAYNNSPNPEDQIGYGVHSSDTINGFKYKKYNPKLGIGLDYDAWADSDDSRGKSIENIGNINASNSPDGIYGVYIDNFGNRTGRDTPFNFFTLYKDEGETEFKRVLWLRGTMPKDKPRAGGISGLDINKALHILDLRKQGKKFTLERITHQMEVVYEYNYRNRS